MKRNKCVEARELRDSLRSLMVAHGALEEARRPCGAPLSMPHAYALLELIQNSEALSVSELAERLRIDRSNVSRLCAKMEREGELLRVVDPDDARAWRLELTKKGRTLARSVDESSAGHFQRVVKRLGEDSENVTAALVSLRLALLGDSHESRSDAPEKERR